MKHLAQALTFIGIFTLLVFILRMDETNSQSGSSQYLRDNGTYSTTRKHGVDILFYKSKNNTYSKKELKALSRKSEFYIIVIK